MRRWFGCFATCVVMGSMIAGSTARAQQSSAGPAPLAPDELPPIPEVRELVATVDETAVYMDELEPLQVAKDARPESPGSAGFERWLDQTRARSLQYRVVQLLQARICEEQGIVPTEDEITALRAFRTEQQQKRLEDLIRMRDGMERDVNLSRMAGNEPADEVLVELRRLRQETALAQKVLDGRKPKNRDQARAMEIAERQFAEDSVRSWKFTRFLHEKYGGKVIIVSGHPQPIEAYIQLFAEEQQEGRLIFASDWARGAVVGSMEALKPQLVDAPPGSFETPWWAPSN